MGYIEKNLSNDEVLIYRGRIHPMIFLSTLIWAVFGILLIRSGPSALSGMVPLVIAMYLGIKALLIFLSTDLAITSKRMVAKTGFIRRTSVELNHTKVESIVVDQSILGRIFSYGTIVIQGSGGGRTPIPGISKPLEFRKRAVEAVDQSGK